MTSLKAFPNFTRLPPELQLQIWESTVATRPAMHLVDVCVPPPTNAPSQTTGLGGTTRPTPVPDSPNKTQGPNHLEPPKTTAAHPDQASDTLYLTALATADMCKPDSCTCSPAATSRAGPVQGALFRSDPSMYRFRASLRAACVDAAEAIRKSTKGLAAHSSDTNTVRLAPPPDDDACSPGPTSITYDNRQDVLHLRFVPPGFRFPGAGRHTSPLSAIFESIWSEELAGALHRARRVAIDVSQLWPDLWARRGGGGNEDGAEDDSLIMQDIAFLACTMQNNLEVLYLVDYCAGRCDSIGARDLMSREDTGLYRALRNGETWRKEKQREPDVIYGVGKIWREVFDLEKLGWDEKHPGYVFAEMFGEVVRMQQGTWMGDDTQDRKFAKETIKFQGLRVLVAEDDEANGEEAPMLLRCNSHRLSSRKPECQIASV